MLLLSSSVFFFELPPPPPVPREAARLRRRTSAPSRRLRGLHGSVETGRRGARPLPRRGVFLCFFFVVVVDRNEKKIDVSSGGKKYPSLSRFLSALSLLLSLSPLSLCSVRRTVHERENALRQLEHGAGLRSCTRGQRRRRTDEERREGRQSAMPLRHRYRLLLRQRRRATTTSRALLVLLRDGQRDRYGVADRSPLSSEERNSEASFFFFFLSNHQGPSRKKK